MNAVPLQVRGARQNVSNEHVRRLFIEAAHLRGQTLEEFASCVGEQLGWLKFDRLGDENADAETCMRGVLVLLGLRPDKDGHMRRVMRAWRAYQVAYFLGLESTTDAVAA